MTITKLRAKLSAKLNPVDGQHCTWTTSPRWLAGVIEVACGRPVEGGGKSMCAEHQWRIDHGAPAPWSTERNVAIAPATAEAYRKVSAQSGWRISAGRDEDGTWSAALSMAAEDLDDVWQFVWNKPGFATRDEAIEAAREVAAECDARFEAQVLEEAGR